MSTALAEPDIDFDDEVTEAAARPCVMVEMRVCPTHGTDIAPCDQPAAFEVLTRCQVDSDGQARDVCVHHERMLRLHPEILRCSAGHRSEVVAVLPIGGGDR